MRVSTIRSPGSKAVLVVLPFLLLGGSMLPGKVLAPSGTERSLPWRSSATDLERALPQMNADTVRENLVYRAFLHETVGQGSVPWWSPYWFGGLPFVASSHTQALYPLTWLLARFDPYSSFGLSIALHLCIAGVGMLAFLKHSGRSGGAALFGALAFMLNGMFATRHGHPQFAASACWLPWVLLGGSQITGGQWMRGAALVASATALTVLAGHPSVYVYGFYFIGTFLLGQVFLFDSNSEGTVAISKASVLAVFAGGAALGLGLASTQLLAVLELSRFSDRTAVALETGLAQLPHWMHLLRAVFPNASGTPIAANYWSASDTSYTAGILYIGIAPLVLACIGAIRGGRRGAVVAAIVAAALCVIYVPLFYRLAYDFLPGFQFSRVDRLGIAWFLGVPFLAALGMDVVLERGRSVATSPLVWVVGGASAMVLAALTFSALAPAGSDAGALTGALARGGALFGAVALWLFAAQRWPRTRHLPGALAALTVIDLFSYALPFVVVRDAGRIFRATPATRFLSEAEGPFRIAKYAASPGIGKTLFQANTPAVYGIEDLHGFGPLHIRDLDVLIRAVEDRPATPRNLRPFSELRSLSSPLLDLLQVRYILSASPVPTDRESRSGLRLVHSGDLYIYENLDVLPRAMFLPNWRVEPDPELAAELIAGGSIDVRDTAVLEHAPESASPDRNAGSDRGSDGNRVDIASRSSERVELTKIGPDAGLVRLADLHYPGWTASVDGIPTEVLRADVALRAVPIGPGDHTIVFEYRPTFGTAALWTTALSALALVGLLWRGRREAALRR